MDKRFLVTTSIKETFPKNEPILLLGEWIDLLQKNKLDLLDIKVL